MLCYLIWIPLITAFFLILMPIQGARLAKCIALFPMLIVLGLSLFVFCHVREMDNGYAYEVRYNWVPAMGISYHLGVNLLSGLLILLSSLVGVAAIGISRPTSHARYFYALGLIMIGGMIGAFASLDLFFLYIFHEFALIPTFILIGIWGAEARRQAAMKITLYLGLGSLILLLGFVGIYFFAGGNTFDLIDLKTKFASIPLAPSTQIQLFGILFLGFGILISVFPFHTWAPAGYGEAPPLASMLHAGVIKKFGFYGLIAVAAPLLPTGFEYWKSTIVWLALGNLIYCGYVAMQQKDLRYMLAYSSISHMGYAFLAFAAGTPLAMQGLILFLFAHGVSAAAGFAIAGYCREQTGTSLLSELGGLASKMPFTACIFTIAALASCGLPGLANFPAELMIFMGSFQSFEWFTIGAVWTVVISAVYLLRAIRAIFLGPVSDKWTSVQDMDYGRRIILALLIIALLGIGFWPRAVMNHASFTPKTLLK